jgi:hypothetical protein
MGREGRFWQPAVGSGRRVRDHGRTHGQVLVRGLRGALQVERPANESADGTSEKHRDRLADDPTKHPDQCYPAIAGFFLSTHHHGATLGLVRSSTEEGFVRSKLLAGAGLVALAGMMSGFVLSGPSASSADLLPDEGMTNLRSFRIDTTTIPGRTLLRFTTESVNIGAGPLELRGSRPDTRTPTMSVVQRIYDNSGGFRSLSVPTNIFWGGDGHEHWHVNDFVSTELERMDNGVKVGTFAKQGFCLADINSFNLSLPGAPSSKVYKGCVQGGQNSLAVKMGISVGWADRYGYRLNFQWVDITGLTPGRYKLIGTVDAQNHYLESDETNNTTWTILQLNGNNTIKVIQQGPHL